MSEASGRRMWGQKPGQPKNKSVFKSGKFGKKSVRIFVYTDIESKLYFNKNTNIIYKGFTLKEKRS